MTTPAALPAQSLPAPSPAANPETTDFWTATAEGRNPLNPH
jgi:hypothetical protein